MEASIRDLRIPPATTLTIVALVVIFLVHILTGEFKADRHTLRPEQGFQPNKWYRFFTSTLVHANWEYLVLSIIGLLVFGTRLERKLGTMLFLYMQSVAFVGTVLMFCALGSILYFISAYDRWLEAKHTGFAPIIFCYAVVDSYIGKRDFFRLVIPWILVPLLPMALPRVSVLSAFAGASFGFVLARWLGRKIMPGRSACLRAENSSVARVLMGLSSSFCSTWPETSSDPFIQSSEGWMWSDLHPTYETLRLIPMSSKDTGAATSGTATSNLQATNV